MKTSILSTENVNVFFIEEIRKQINLFLAKEITLSKFVELLNDKATDSHAMERIKMMEEYRQQGSGWEKMAKIAPPEKWEKMYEHYQELLTKDSARDFHLETLQKQWASCNGMQWVLAKKCLPKQFGRITWRWIDKQASYCGYTKRGFVFGDKGASVSPDYYDQIEWLDESGADSEPVTVAGYIPCSEDDPDHIGDFISKDGQSMCRLKESKVVQPAFPTEEQIRLAANKFYGQECADQCTGSPYLSPSCLAKFLMEWMTPSQLSNKQNK